MRKRTTVTACRIPDEHLDALKSIAARWNLPVGTFLKTLIREFIENRLIIKIPWNQYDRLTIVGLPIGNN